MSPPARARRTRAGRRRLSTRGRAGVGNRVGRVTYRRVTNGQCASTSEVNVWRDFSGVCLVNDGGVWWCIWEKRVSGGS